MSERKIKGDFKGNIFYKILLCYYSLKMFIRKYKKKSGTYLALVETVKDKKTGKWKQRYLMSLGRAYRANDKSLEDLLNRKKNQLKGIKKKEFKKLRKILDPKK